MTTDIAIAERRRGRPSEAERRLIDDRVLDAAFAAFHTKGFEATQMDKVAAAAGITKVSLYRRFAGKGEMLAQVLLAQAGWIPATIPVLSPADDPIDRLKTLMWKYRQQIGEERMISVQRLALATQHVEPAVHAAMASVRARYVAPVDMLVDASKSRGQLPDVPTAELREILFGLLVNDAAALPLHGYPSQKDQQGAFAIRWEVFERGLMTRGR